MKILGIDPGLCVTGYGLIDEKDMKLVEAGVIKTRFGAPVEDRVKKIFDEIAGIVEEHSPGVLVLEKIYSHYKHPTTSILMGHARAMACLVCGKFNIRLINYPSTRIKKIITGNGHASKDQVQRMVQNMLRLKNAPEPKDVSDALAMALCYCYTENMKFQISNFKL